MPREAHHSKNWGGSRPNSGRRGTPDKYARNLARRAHEEGIHPYDLLIGIVRDEEADKKDRMYCAGTLMPYVAQRLMQTEVRVTNELDTLTTAEKIALASSLRAGILEQRPDMTLPAIEGEVVKVNGKSK